MRIRRLQIKDFRRYRDLDIDFAPGLTVVRGPNEAGKTTIQRAIELAITRRATSGANDLNVLRPWDAPADARTIINLEFEQDEDDVTKTGTLEKVFGGAKGTVDLRYDGQSITDPTLSDQVIAELTGIPTEAFFRSTASVRHHELADIERDESALHDRLQASISGADRGTSRAKRKLERAIFELATKGDKNPGRLKVAEAALAQATASLEQGETALAQLERDRDTLAGARERRVESETALAERRSLLEKARQAERLTAEQTAAQERFERYREAAQVVATLTALADSHPSANPLPVLRKVVERLREVDTRIRELKAALAGEVEVTFEIPPEPTWRPLSRVAVILVLVGLLVAGGTFIARTFLSVEIPSELQLVGFGMAVIGAILAAVALWLRRSDRLQQQLRDIDIDRRLRGRSDMEQELREAEADVAQQLETLGLEDVAAAEDLLAQRRGARPADRPARGAAQGPHRLRAGRIPAEGARCRRPGHRTEDPRARSARADRQGTPRARAARGRGARPGTGARARPRRRGQRARPRRGQQRGCRAGGRVRRAGRRLRARSWRPSSAGSASTSRRSRRSSAPSRRR